MWAWFILSWVNVKGDLTSEMQPEAQTMWTTRQQRSSKLSYCLERQFDPTHDYLGILGIMYSICAWGHTSQAGKNQNIAARVLPVLLRP